MQEGPDGNRAVTREGQGSALDPRWVELVLACLVAGCAFIVLPRSILVPSLLAPALAVDAAALARRWSAGGRLAAFLLLLAVVGVAPTLATMDAYHTTFLPTYGHDGGVIVTGRRPRSCSPATTPTPPPTPVASGAAPCSSTAPGPRTRS